MSVSGRQLTSYQRLQRHVSLTWYPISIALFMFCLFSTFGLAAGQVQEALANYVADRDHPWAGFAYARAAITLIAIFIFANTLRYWTARLLGVDLRRIEAPDVLNTWQRAFIGIAWFAPWIGASLSFLDAALALQGAHASAARSFGEDFFHLAGALARDPLRTPFPLLAAATLIAPFLFFTLRWSGPMRYLHRAIGHLLIVRAVRGWALPSVFLLLGVLFLAMPPLAIDLSRELGPVVLVCLSFAAVTAAGAWLIHFGRMRGLPAFAVVAVTPFLLGALGLDDNHYIRQRGPLMVSERPNVADALRDFQSQLGGGPIILVSAEGGGIRAAHYTALVLARFADQCPRLARRIFVISAVSGGAIGAAAYRASLERMPLEGDACDLDRAAPMGPRQRALNEMFSYDHLSPTLAKQVFPELAQAFAPASLSDSSAAFIPQTDRQLGLELSLEESFARAFAIGGAPNPLTASVFGPSAAPHVLINMTEVSSGGVFVAGPIDLNSVRQRQSWLHDFRCLWSDDPESAAPCNRSPDFRLSTMAASSARFPIVSPAGAVRANGATFRFVDGGYFDNSGVETLLGLYEHLHSTATASGRALPPFAVLHIDSNPYEQRLPVKWRLDLDVHELQAVLATREERVRISLSRLNNLYRDDGVCSVRYVEVTDNRVPLRLGWILSAPAAQELQGQVANQLALAFAGERPVLCDNSESSELHAASERYAERLALAPSGVP